MFHKEPPAYINECLPFTLTFHIALSLCIGVSMRTSIKTFKKLRQTMGMYYALYFNVFFYPKPIASCTEHIHHEKNSIVIYTLLIKIYLLRLRHEKQMHNRTSKQVLRHRLLPFAQRLYWVCKSKCYGGTCPLGLVMLKLIVLFIKTERQNANAWKPVKIPCSFY